MANETFPNEVYAPPGVYTNTRYENPTASLLNGVRVPVLIGTGSETLYRNNLEMVRGSSSTVDQRIVQEEETGRSVVSVSVTGAVTLGDFDGVRTRIQVMKYPIVNGNGTGTLATKTSSVSVTINGVPVVVTSMVATTGILTLSAAPALGDDVRVTYFFKRTDTLITDDVSDQVTAESASIYGAVGSPFQVTAGENDTLVLKVDDKTTVTVTIPDSGSTTWTAAQVAAFINAAASTTSLVASAVENNYGDTVLLLVADGNILVQAGSANSTVGLSAGQYTDRNKTFYTFQGPIVDGSNGGVTTTNPALVTVKVDGVTVVATAVDGSNRAVTLPAAPVDGAVVKITYYFNAWQDTFDYLENVGITAITSCGVAPTRTDYTDQVDFVLKDNRIVWGSAVLVSSGVHTTDTSYFGSSQITGSLVDVRDYAQPCTAVVDTSVSPPRESRVKFTLPHVPTTGNGRGSPLGTSLFQTVSNGRIDLPTNRPDLVVAYWGYGVQDALERGPVKVLAVDSSTSTITLKAPVPVGAEVFATFYYNTLVDQEYSVSVSVPGPSGVGSYSVFDEAGDVLLTPRYGTKSAGLSTITLQFPSGSERKPDVRFEPPAVTTDYTGPVEEDVTVTFASTDGTLGQFTVPGAGDYSIVLNASDRMRLLVDGSALAGGAAGIDLGSVNGVANLGFAASLVGDKVAYTAADGYLTYEVDSTNDSLSVLVDGVLISGTAATSATATVEAYVAALNTAADTTHPELQSTGQMQSSLVVTASEYDQLRFHYTGDVSGLSGVLLATVTPATYTSVTTLATAVQTAMETAISGLGPEFTGLTVGVEGNSAGRLVFTLTRASGNAASGTVTVNTVLNGNSVAVDGVFFTAVTGARTSGANDFDRSGTDVDTATSLVAALNDEANWPGAPPITASNDAGTSAVVSITAVDIGTGGNSITLASSGATLAVSGATLEDGTEPDTSGYLEFITHGTPGRDFAILAGIDTAAATAGAQTKLVDGPVARRFSIVGDNTSTLTNDRIIMRSRVVPGWGSVAPYHTLSYAGLTVQGGTGSVNAGLVPQTTTHAGWNACIQSATLLGVVGFAGGQVASGVYSDARDGQPLVTFYAAGGTTTQNNIFKFTMDGVPVTVTFTDAAGVAIASGGSAEVPLGPATTANTVLAQIRAAVTAAGLASASSRVVQEGAAIRLVSGSYTTASAITIGNGSANDVLGFVEAANVARSLVPPDVVASALMSHIASAISDVLNAWTTPTATYFAAEALASVVEDSAGSRFLFLQSQGTEGLGVASSVAFATPSSDSILLPTTGLGVVTGDGGTGEAGISGYYVQSSDTENGSGTINTSILNGGVGQDGIVGQTYHDLVTGLTFTILPRSGGAAYPAAQYFTFKVRAVTLTDSNLPINTIPGLELLVTSTLGVGVSDTAIVETFARGGEEPAIGDVYYVSYAFTQPDFSPRLFSNIADVEAQYGALSVDNPVTLGAYLAFINGAPQVAIKQVQKDLDLNGDGIMDAASTEAFRNAVDSLAGSFGRGVQPSILVPLKGDSVEFFQYITRHADVQSDMRHRSERTVIAGVSAGTAPRDVGAIARAVQRTRFRLVYPDLFYVTLPVDNGTTEEVLVDGFYAAAMLAGSVVASDVATPWTNRRLLGGRLARTLAPVEQNQVATNGITIIEDDSPVLRVREGLTSDMIGASTGGNVNLSKHPTIIQIQDEVNQQCRKTLNRFIGGKFLPGVTTQIEGQLSTTLRQLVEAQIISSYTGVKATVSASDPTVAEVVATIVPIFPLLYITVTFNLRSSSN